MKNMTVLFVDDESRILSALERGLSKEPFCRRYSQSAQEALEVMATEPIHVVVTDMKMPEMDGLTFLRKVKKISPRTVRVVLSGYVCVSQIIPCINTGEIFRYETKPLDIRDLLLVLREAMAKYNDMEQYEVKLDRLMAENEELRKDLVQVQSQSGAFKRRWTEDLLLKGTNKENLYRLVELEVSYARREMLDLSLMLLQFDCFEFFKNKYGELLGESCIREVCDILDCQFMINDYIFSRLSYDKILIILSGTCFDKAIQLAEDIRCVVEELAIPHGESDAGPFVTISAGVVSFAPYMKEKLSPQEMTAHATRALCEARVSGKNCVKGLTVDCRA